MNLEESIEYLKNYKYDNEVRQAIETLLTAYEKEKEKREIAEADLYEANNRINDLLDIVKEKDKIIDDMLEEYEYKVGINLENFCEDEMRKDKCIQDCKICVKKYFEERCK